MLYPNPGVDSRPSSWSTLGRLVVPPILLTLLLAAVYADPLFTRRSFVGRDLVLYALPLEKEVHDAWARGRLPVWSADVSGGRPLFPNPNAGSLYPVRPLLSRLSFPAAMRLFPVLHWILAGLGMLALLSVLGASPPAAWVAAVTYVFSGVMVSEVFYLATAPAAALQPWILWAVVRTGANPRRKAVVIGLVDGLLFLVGDVFAMVIAAGASVAWIALEVEAGRRLRELAVLAGGGVLAVALAAPQVVATALLVPQTRRAVMGIPLREVLRFTLSPWRLAELVVPYPFGETWTLEEGVAWTDTVFRSYFLTLYAGAFAVAALVLLWRSRERGTRFVRVLFVASLLFAMAGGLVPAGRRDGASPIPLRFPEKFSVAVVLALALGAGLAFDRCRRGELPRRSLLGVAAALALAAVAARAFPALVGTAAVEAVGAPPALGARAGRQLAAALAEAGVLWVVTWIAVDQLRGPGRARLGACLALLTAVPIAANRRLARTENEASVYPPTAFARTIARADPGREFRTVDLSSFAPPSPLLFAAWRGDDALTESARRNWSFLTPVFWRRGMVFNGDPDRGDLSRLESLRRVAALAAAQPYAAGFFASLALRYGIRYRDQAPLPGYRRFGGDAFQDWDENPEARPSVRLLERWREEPGALEALGAVSGLAPGEIVLETGGRASGSARGGTVRLDEDGPERFAGETETADAGWLFALRGYWPYRTVLVDGREVECVPAQLAFSAVPIPAGRHRVEWREEVPGLSVSRFGPALFALVAGVLWRPRRAGLPA